MIFFGISLNSAVELILWVAFIPTFFRCIIFMFPRHLIKFVLPVNIIYRLTAPHIREIKAMTQTE